MKTYWIWMDENASRNQFILQIFQNKHQTSKKLQELELHQTLAKVSKLRGAFNKFPDFLYRHLKLL